VGPTPNRLLFRFLSQQEGAKFALAAEFAVIPPGKATVSPLFNLSERSSDTTERRIVVASVWRERFALGPAHMGKRSGRSAFSSTPERHFMRNLREDSPPSGP
jgi:hypothetical protein